VAKKNRSAIGFPITVSKKKSHPTPSPPWPLSHAATEEDAYTAGKSAEDLHQQVKMIPHHRKSIDLGKKQAGHPLH
jgi:uncharacterized protein (DUF305 family)